MQLYMATQTNHQLTKVCSGKYIDIVIYLWMGKTYTEKPPLGDFKVTFLRIHYYQNKQLQVKESQYLIPTYS